MEDNQPSPCLPYMFKFMLQAFILCIVRVRIHNVLPHPNDRPSGYAQESLTVAFAEIGLDDNEA
jgi:hypothetical protein